MHKTSFYTYYFVPIKPDQTFRHIKRILTILTWTNLYFTEKVHWNTRLAAPDIFHIFTKSIKFFY